MPEYKVGDRVLVEGVVARTGDLFSGERFCDVDLLNRPQQMSWAEVELRPLPPEGVLGYSEEGNEIRRGENIPKGWERRYAGRPDYPWSVSWSLEVSISLALYECRAPERQQTVEEAARELLEALPADPLLANLRDALEREGRSDG